MAPPALLLLLCLLGSGASEQIDVTELATGGKTIRYCWLSKSETPYGVYEPPLSEPTYERKQQIRDAFKFLEKKTCLKFVEQTDVVCEDVRADRSPISIGFVDQFDSPATLAQADSTSMVFRTADHFITTHELLHYFYYGHIKIWSRYYENSLMHFSYLGHGQVADYDFINKLFCYVNEPIVSILELSKPCNGVGLYRGNHNDGSPACNCISAFQGPQCKTLVDTTGSVSGRRNVKLFPQSADTSLSWSISTKAGMPSRAGFVLHTAPGSKISLKAKKTPGDAHHFRIYADCDTYMTKIFNLENWLSEEIVETERGITCLTLIKPKPAPNQSQDATVELTVEVTN